MLILSVFMVPIWLGCAASGGNVLKSTKGQEAAMKTPSAVETTGECAMSTCHETPDVPANKPSALVSTEVPYNDETGEIALQDTPKVKEQKELHSIEYDDAVAVVNGVEISKRTMIDFVTDWYWERPLVEMVCRMVERSRQKFSELDDDAPLVVVRGEAITKGDLVAYISKDSTYWERPLENLIREVLIEQEVERLGITTSAEQIEQRIEKEIENRREHLKATGGADGKTLEEILAEEGQTLEELKEQLRKSRDLLLYMALEKLVKYDELREEKVEVRHIVLERHERAKALEILEKIKEGADFATLARKESKDAAAANGGLLPPFGRGVMIKEFEDAAFALSPGELSGVVETPIGLHIIKCISRREKRNVSFAQMEEEVWKAIMEEGVSEESMRRWVDALYQRSDVKVLVK